MNYIRVVLLLGTVCLFGACMSIPGAALMLSDADGRVGLDQQRLGDSREIVMTDAKNSIAEAPLCMARRMAIAGSRKAFMQEICTFKPASDGISFEDLPIETISYRFVDGILVRLDIEMVASGDAAESAVDTIESHLSGQFGKTSDDPKGTPDANRSENDGSHLAARWFRGDDEISLIAGPLTVVEPELTQELDEVMQSYQERHLSVRFLDAALAERAPALVD